MQMLDYTNREIDLNGTKVIITNELLKSALCPDLAGQNKDDLSINNIRLK